MSGTKSQDQEHQVLNHHLADLEHYLCATLYSQDEDWENEYRLVAMDRVQFPEPMFGFVLNDQSRENLFSNDEDVKFYSQEDTESLYREIYEHEYQIMHDLIKTNKLYGGFLHREGVRSFCRIGHKDTSGIFWILFVNFDVALSQISSTKDIHESLLSNIKEIVGQVRKARNTSLSEDGNRGPSAKLIQVLQTTEKLARQEYGTLADTQTEKTFLTKVVKMLHRVFDLGENGFATIHRCNHFDSQNLTLSSVSTPNPHTMSSSSQSIVSGEGVAAWVALHRKAIVISNMSDSGFREIHKEIHESVGLEPTQSQLAAPILLGDKLLGVLNVESTEPNKFQPNHVQTLWHAASQVAASLQLCNSSRHVQSKNQTLEQLFTTCSKSLEKPELGHELLDEIGDQFKNWYQSDDCDIWIFDKEKSQFSKSMNILDQNVGEGVVPRQDGWSSVLIDRHPYVWITNIRSANEFDAYVWEDESSDSWSEANKEGFPKKVHNVLGEERVHCELGVRLKLNTCKTVVIWLKFKETFPRRPDQQQLEEVDSFCMTFKVVLEILERYKSQRSTSRRLADFAESIQDTPGKLKVPNVKELDIFAEVKPSEDVGIGGDFLDFSVEHLADNKKTTRVGVIIGDGEGHGINGAMHMLPILTAYKMIKSQSMASTKHVLSEMNRVAHELNVKGTALSFLMELQNDEKSGNRSCIISGSTAGHPHALIFNKNGNNRPFPSIHDEYDTAHSMLGLPTWPPLGESFQSIRNDDILFVAYTDGISEAGFTAELEKNKEHTLQQGCRSIISTVTNLLDESARTIGEAIFEDAIKRGTDDDMTVIVIRFDLANGDDNNPNQM